jgi:hypothetical protein
MNIIAVNETDNLNVSVLTKMSTKWCGFEKEGKIRFMVSRQVAIVPACPTSSPLA